MSLLNIDGEQSEFLSIYNGNGENIVIYISSSDRRDYTEDVESILKDKQGQTLTLSDILEGLDIAVVLEKDNAINEFLYLSNQIERWKRNE